MLWSMGSQRIRYDLATEQQQELIFNVVLVSSVWQSDSDVYKICLFSDSFPL